MLLTINKMLNFVRSSVAAILNRVTNSNDVILNQKNDVCHFVTDNRESRNLYSLTAQKL